MAPSFLLLAVATLLCSHANAAPVESDRTPAVVSAPSDNYPDSALKDDVSEENYFPEDEERENELQRLEEDVAKAETAKLLAGAIQAEQKLEAGILSSAAAVATAGLAPGPPGETLEAKERRRAAAAEEMEVLEDMVERDKRAVELIQGILGGSSGGGDAASANDAKQDEGSGSGGSTGSGGVLFSLISSFLSGSSSSSGSAKANDDSTTDDENASGRQFSALGLITSSVSTVLRIKFSIFRTLFSFVKGLIIPSS